VAAGLLFTRDHHDLGARLLKLGEIGHAYFSHNEKLELVPSRNCLNGLYTSGIALPDDRCGRNGDLQTIEVEVSLHPPLRRGGGSIRSSGFPPTRTKASWGAERRRTGTPA
jgi:hypothetical protein